MDKMVYIVGSEQIHHFKVLFTILKILGYTFAKKCYHLPYGMVYLPEGKMKSREGKIVDADNLIDEIKNLAKKEVMLRDKSIGKRELDNRSEHIAQAAIKFFLLNRDPLKDFTFVPEESISFEGDTGPYVQYTFARANSILRKVKNFKSDFNFNRDEYLLVKKLAKFPDIIKEAAINYKPHHITNYVLEISKQFNEFYQKYPVLKAENNSRNSRITLVMATAQVIKNSLGLLGIKTLSKM